MYRLLLLSYVLLFITACQANTSTHNNSTNSTTNTTTANTNQLKLLPGIWKGQLELAENTILPFSIEVTHKGISNYIFTVINGKERVPMDVDFIGEDSLRISSPVYDSAFQLTFTPNRMRGKWFNYAIDKDYSLDFYAVHGDSSRFYIPLTNTVADVAGKWSIIMVDADRTKRTDGILEMTQQGQEVNASILTPTGDYRYLNGFTGDSDIKLSTFDGSHAYLITGIIDELGEINGTFYSGSHYRADINAYRNDTASLPDAYTYSQIKENYSLPTTSFTDTDGNTLRLTDAAQNGKPLLIQIMGSWCPNCFDESQFYKSIYEKYHPEGLEVVALAFENVDTYQEALPKLKQYKSYLNLPYPIAYAGNANKKTATETIQVLKEVKSFPTSIFVNADGTIASVHTGFTGPATSTFPALKKSIEATVEGLLYKDS